MAAKLEYDSSLGFDQVSQAIDVTEANVRKAVPAARMIYIEPDLERDDAEPATSAGDQGH